MHSIDKEIQKILEYVNNGRPSAVSVEAIREQLVLFNEGVKIPELVKPCIIGDGIVEIKEEEQLTLSLNHSDAAEQCRIIKFVPASGVASRMFQKLLSVINKYGYLSYDNLKEKESADSECEYVLNFLNNIKSFAFYDQLKEALNADDLEIQSILKNAPAKIINAILFEDGLNYLNKPKGTIKFHKYENYSRTAFEEQIYESLSYLVDKNNEVKIHFTILEEHKELFIPIAVRTKADLHYDYKLDITFSYQKNSTHIIAVNEKNEILFDNDGNIVLRPAGHGALLENLNQLNADIVVIKNIDNVAISQFTDNIIAQKKILIGYLIKIQNKVFEFLKILDRNNFHSDIFDEIAQYSEKVLFINIPEGFRHWAANEKAEYLFNKLNRPIRICGMVKNVGEPGGGPFWVKNEDGSLSLQIIEQSQINLQDTNQLSIFKASTHFNPVDLVCGLKDYKGSNFDLTKFVDRKSSIITQKSKDGTQIKVLEVPGLWNGSMADWISIFVEVPLNTFNPVKEVNDLLRKEHQN